MIDDIEMLTSVMQSAEMGCQGIVSVRKRLHDSKVDSVLCDQLVKYGKLYYCASRMLKNRGAQVRHISPLTKAMTRYSAQRNLRSDSSASHVAEMMIKGSTMGVNKMSRNIRSYNGRDEHVIKLARRMLDAEDENIGELKKFL